MKRNSEKIFFVVLVVVICLGTVILMADVILNDPQEVEPEFVLRYGEVNSTGHIMSDTAYYFADCVKELSEGKVVVKIYPSGQMGDDAHCYKAMEMGALDLYRGNSASMTAEESSMISVMSLPYLFDDSDHFWKVCDSELGKQMLTEIDENFNGIRGLTFLDEGARNFMTINGPIRQISDMEGLRFRTLDSEILMDTVRALGADAVSLEYVELYSALESKRVDGAENPLISYYYNKFYETAPYYVKDGHTYSPSVLLMSQITWDALGEEYQSIIMKASDMARDFNKKKMESAEQQVLSLIQNENVQITELVDIEQWRAAVKPVYEKYGAGYEEIIEQIQNMK